MSSDEVELSHIVEDEQHLSNPLPRKSPVESRRPEAITLQGQRGVRKKPPIAECPYSVTRIFVLLQLQRLGCEVLSLSQTATLVPRGSSSFLMLELYLAAW